MLNKKGLSEIVMTIIIIGLVLVAIGIVWAVVLNILEGQTESIDYNQRCLGLVLGIKDLSCTGTACNFVVERKAGSKGDPIDGIAVTFSNASSSNQVLVLGNVDASKTVSNLETAITAATKADARVYFTKEDATQFYCSQVFSTQ